MTSITKTALHNSDSMKPQLSSLSSQPDTSFSEMLNKHVPEKKNDETQRNQVTSKNNDPKDNTKHEVNNDAKKNMSPDANTEKVTEDNELTSGQERQPSQALSENNTSPENENKGEHLPNMLIEDDVLGARQEALFIRQWDVDLLPGVQGSVSGDSELALANYQAAFNSHSRSDKEKSVDLAANRLIDKTRVLPGSITEGYRLANSFTELSLSEANLSLNSQDPSMSSEHLMLKNFDAMLARLEPQANFQNVLDKSSLAAGLEQIAARGSMENINSMASQGTASTAKLMNMPMTHYALETPFQQAGWGDAFNKRINMMVRGEVQKAELHLNPKELGPVEVKIKLSHDQASISFSAQHGVVREAIESALPRLREMLAESGLTLAGADVSPQFSQQQQGFQDERDSDSYVAEPTSNDDEGGENISIIRGMDGLVDYFA